MYQRKGQWPQLSCHGVLCAGYIIDFNNQSACDKLVAHFSITDWHRVIHFAVQERLAFQIMSMVNQNIRVLQPQMSSQGYGSSWPEM